MSGGRSRPPRSILVIGALSVAVTFVGAACSSSAAPKANGTTTTPTTTTSATTPTTTTTAGTSSGSTQSLNAMLPANIRSAGVLTVASSIGYPPYEFYASDGKTFDGIDIDLINAVGKALGVKVKITDTRYPNITPALQANRFDLAISAIPDDQAGPYVDLVNYLDDASGGYIVAANNTAFKTKDPTSMCGATVGIVQGETTELPFLNAISKSCKSEGKPGISTKIFAQTATILLGIESGQVTARGASVSQGEYDSKQSPTKLKFVPDVIPAEAAVKDPTGIAIPKKSTQLVTAIEAAMNELHSDGTYQQIFKKWDVTATEIPVSVAK